MYQSKTENLHPVSNLGVATMQNTVTHYRVDQMSSQERARLSNMGLNVMPGGSVTINECRPNGEVHLHIFAENIFSLPF
jgi:hypothetical protein